MVRCLSESKRSASVSQIKAEGVKCHSFYKIHGEVENLKVLTFVETVTSMSGAVRVPDLSANQVAIKALKKLIVVNSFTVSVLQCDGHSGLLALQEQVGRDMSLPIQVSPPYSHQSLGTVERFHKTLYGQVRAIRITRSSLRSHRRVTSTLDSSACSLSDQPLPWTTEHWGLSLLTCLRRLQRNLIEMMKD